MFKIQTSSTYSFPVTVEIAADGGKFQKSTFDAEFKRLSKSEVKNLFERLPSPNKEVDNPLDDDGVLDLVFVGWKGVQDEAGQDLPYSETSRAALLDIQGVAAGVVRAYFASLSGSRVKN